MREILYLLESSFLPMAFSFIGNNLEILPIAYLLLKTRDVLFHSRNKASVKEQDWDNKVSGGDSFHPVSTEHRDNVEIGIVLSHDEINDHILNR